MSTILFEQSPIALLMVDADRRCFAANAASRAYVDVHQPDPVGQRVDDVVASSFVVGDEWPRFLSGERRRTTLSRAAGSPSVADLICVSSLPKGGSLIALLPVDQTERLDQELHLVRELFERLPLGVHIAAVTSQGTFERVDYQYVNPAMRQLLGYPAEMWAAPDFFPSLLHDDDRARVLTDVAEFEARRGTHAESEFRVRHANGAFIWFAMGVHVVRDDLGQALRRCSYARDITEQKRIGERLQRSQRMETVGQLAGGVAHEFNNLLMAISGHAGLAIEVLEDGGPSDRACSSITQVQRAADRAAALTRQLLAFARRQTLLPRPVQLAEAVDAAATLVRVLIPADVELTISNADPSPVINVDRASFEQMVVNLVVNGCEAIDGRGEIAISTDFVEIGDSSSLVDWGAEPGRYACMVVRDNGRGMSVDVLARAFEPFFTTKDVGDGSGLGLSMIYGIVKQSGGWIDLTSEPGKGTQAMVYLPLLESLPPRG